MSVCLQLNTFVPKPEFRAAAVKFISCTLQASEYKPTELKGRPLVQCIPHLESSTCTYVVSDPATSKAVVIDCVCDYDPAAGTLSFKHADQVIKFVQDRKLAVEMIVSLGFVLNRNVSLICCCQIETHVHADHLTAAQYLKSKLGGKIAIGRRVVYVRLLLLAMLHLILAIGPNRCRTSLAPSFVWTRRNCLVTARSSTCSWATGKNGSSARLTARFCCFLGLGA